MVIVVQQFYSQYHISRIESEENKGVLSLNMVNPINDTLVLGNYFEGSCRISFDSISKRRGYSKSDLFIIPPMDSIKLRVDTFECDSIIIELASLKKMKFNKKLNLYLIKKNQYELTLPSGNIIRK